MITAFPAGNYGSMHITAANRRRHYMSVKGLVEGIILQSLEDLWNEGYREESISFFRGRDFSLCADIAGMSTDDQVRMLTMVRDVVDLQKKRTGGTRVPAKTRTPRQRWQAKTELASCS
jgi:hypothetical protein